MNHGKSKCKKKFGIFSRPNKLVEFDTPALIWTQDAPKTRKRFLQYDITLHALKEFLAKNKQFLREKQPGGDLEFDDTEAEKDYDFGIE